MYFLHASLIVWQMSKRSPEADAKGDFWKKMRLGATAVVAVGTGVFAVTSAIRKQGVVSSIFDDLKTALHAALNHLLLHLTSW